MSADQPQVVGKALDAPASTPATDSQPLVDNKLVMAWFGFSLFWMVLGPVLGLVAAMKLDDPDFLANIHWLQFGRMRIAHVNGVIFGLFSTAMFGLMHYAIPKLCGRPLVNNRAAWIGMVLFNVTIFIGEFCLLAGYLQPVEAGEYPWFVDVMVVVAFVTLSYVLLATVALRRTDRMYVSLWYWTAGILWTGINYLIGCIVLPLGPTGATSAAMHGFYLHNVVGLWITPIGLGAVYYFMPITAKNKVYSHALSLIGFWGLAFFYPLNGVHHYIYSPIADWAQTIAIGASLMLMLPVFAFVTNIWGTMLGRWREYVGSSTDSYVLKLGVLGTLWYLLTCIQGPTQAFRDMQALTHFGDYNVGHAHSAVYGAFSIWAMACFYFIYPRVAGRDLWSKKLAGWHYWMQIVGFGVMFSVLSISGWVQGEMQQEGAHWMETVVAIKPLWVARTFGGTLMDMGLALFAFNMIMSLLHGKKVGGGDQSATAAA